MGTIFNWGFKGTTESDSAIDSIFPLALKQDDFVLSDMRSTYTKILTDTLERTHGLSEKQEPLLWDNCVQSDANEGLVTLVVEAMINMTDLFLVYKPSLSIIRRATHEEAEKIRADYKKQAKSQTGVFISFKNYRRSEMLKIYSQFEYCILSSLHKTLNISKAVQIKVNDLRASVSLSDSEIAKGQGKAIAAALRQGKDVMIDKNDEIQTATPDTSSTEKSIEFLDAKRAFILALPLAYISGEQAGGIGATGEADTKAIERGLKQYFVSIVRPILKAIFDVETEFKSEDFRTMTTALEALKTFELVSDEYLSRESKQEILARVFDLDPEEEKKNLAKEEKEREANPEPTQQNPEQPNQPPNQNPNQPPRNNN